MATMMVHFDPFPADLPAYLESGGQSHAPDGPVPVLTGEVLYRGQRIRFEEPLTYITRPVDPKIAVSSIASRISVRFT